MRTSYKSRTIFAGHWQKSHTNTTYACTGVPTPTHISLYLPPHTHIQCSNVHTCCKHIHSCVGHPRCMKSKVPPLHMGDPLNTWGIYRCGPWGQRPPTHSWVVPIEKPPAHMGDPLITWGIYSILSATCVLHCTRHAPHMPHPLCFPFCPMHAPTHISLYLPPRHPHTHKVQQCTHTHTPHRHTHTHTGGGGHPFFHVPQYPKKLPGGLAPPLVDHWGATPYFMHHSSRGAHTHTHTHRHTHTHTHTHTRYVAARNNYTQHTSVWMHPIARRNNMVIGLCC